MLKNQNNSQNFSQGTEERLNSILEQCLSDAERVSFLKTELSLQSNQLENQKNQNDSTVEKLRIKERELNVQYEENDRLKHNYSRLTKRIKSLQEEIKEKKKTKGIFSGLFSDGKGEKDEREKQLTLLQDQLTRTINENENLNRKIENQKRASNLEQKKLKNQLSEAEAQIQVNENELRDLRELTEKYSEQVQRHASDVKSLKEEMKSLKKEAKALEKDLEDERGSSKYFRDCLRQQIALLEDENIDFVEPITIANNIKDFILAVLKSQSQSFKFYENFVRGESNLEEFELIRVSSKNTRKKIGDCLTDLFTVFCDVVKNSEIENVKELKRNVISLKGFFEMLLDLVKGKIVLMKKVNIVLFEDEEEFQKSVKEFENLVALVDNIFRNGIGSMKFRQSFGLLVEKVSSYLGEMDMSNNRKVEFFKRRGAKDGEENFELWKELRGLDLKLARKLVVEVFKLNNVIPSLQEHILSLVSQKDMLGKLSQTESLIISSILKFQSKKKNERQKLKNSDRKFMSQIDNLKKNVEEKDARLAEFEETGLKDKEKIEELKKENKEVLDEMKKNLNEEGAKNLEKMSGELQKSQNENLELHNSIVDLKTEIRDQKEANKDLTDKIGNLKEEIEHKSTLIGDISVQLSSSQEKAKSQQEEIEELQKKLQFTENEKNSIRENLQSQVEQLSEKLVEIMTQQSNQ